MTVTVFIRYQLDPFKHAMFEQYSKNWLSIIPKCGGDLIGYWMPHEGTNNIAFALISFPSLAAYEAYRARLRQEDVARLAGISRATVIALERGSLDRSRVADVRSVATALGMYLDIAIRWQGADLAVGERERRTVTGVREAGGLEGVEAGAGGDVSQGRGDVGDALAGLRGGIGRGAGPSSSFWRAAISAIAKSIEAGLSGGEGR